MTTLQRVSAGQAVSTTDKPVPLDEWLDNLMHERAETIMRLRRLERVLIKHGKLRHESLARKVR